jgi:hypothetical protein
MDRGSGELSAVAIPHPGSDLALESGADAGDPDRIIDEVIRPGLTNGDRRKSGHKTLPWIAVPLAGRHRQSSDDEG